MINNQTASELGEKYRRVIKYALEKYTIDADFSKEPSFFPEMGNSSNYCISNVFSDSIILTSYDQSEKSCLKLLVFCFKLTRTMMAQGFLVRGGIAYGDMFVDQTNSVFVGKALTAAYELESRQEWAGITIESSVINEFPQIFDGSLKYGGYLQCLFVKYCVPMKRGVVSEEYCINWRWNLIAEKGTQSLLGSPTEWSAKTKIENTLKFAKYIREAPLAYPSDQLDCPIEIRSMYVAEGEPGEVMPRHGDEY